MSDTTEAAPTTDADADQAPAQEPETDWKAEARKWEARAKENRSAVKERDELSAALKSKDADLEALRSTVAGFEHAREVDGWKAQVSESLGVPAAVLRGDTLEELTAHGEALKEAMGARPRGPIVPTAGDRPTTTASPLEEVRRGLFGQG